jgi:hypothetical protein
LCTSFERTKTNVANDKSADTNFTIKCFSLLHSIYHWKPIKKHSKAHLKPCLMIWSLFTLSDKGWFQGCEHSSKNASIQSAVCRVFLEKEKQPPGRSEAMVDAMMTPFLTISSSWNIIPNA